MASPAPPGATGPSSRPRSCAPSSTSSARLRLQAADLLGPSSVEQEVERGACERPPGHDGVHRH
eukprot:2937333-Heterocapsa_arctica.AAC.1